MAALSITQYSLLSRNSSTQELKKKNHPRLSLIPVSVCCQSRIPVETEEEEEEKVKEPLLRRLSVGVDKFGKELKQTLSPKQKGDWKDLMLMSLSFAVYVYISQKIVCAYCAWTAMPKQPW